MLKTNYHCHSIFSDGNDTIEEIIKEAITQKLEAIGISDHAPLKIDCECNMPLSKFNKYINEIEQLKQKYNQIKIYKGLEIDWLEDKQNLDYINLEKLDYSIGSIHFMKVAKDTYKPVDYKKEFQIETVKDYFDGDFNKYILKYLDDIKKMITDNSPTIIGHIDLYKKFNKGETLFKEDTPQMLEKIEEILEIAKTKNIAIELNTGGISRGYIDEPYPSIKILQMCYYRGINTIISSDAHNKKHLTAHFEIAEEMLKKVGYKKQLDLKQNIIPFFYK